MAPALGVARSGFRAHGSQGIDDGHSGTGPPSHCAAMSKERYQWANRSAVAAPMRASPAMAIVYQVATKSGESSVHWAAKKVAAMPPAASPATAPARAGLVGAPWHSARRKM